MRKNRHVLEGLIFLSIIALTAFMQKQQKPVAYIIGDSTVRNDDSTGHRGWGSHLDSFLDTTQISVSNQAMAGRSTRTYIKEGRWERVINAIRPGDFLIMQFGHNEGSVPDTTRAGYRGVLRGTGEDTKELVWPNGKPETVHSYGWYLRKFVTEAKAKGANVIVASMIPRNDWKDGKVVRASDNYGKWAAEIAVSEHAWFVNLNDITALKYEKMGQEQVKPLFPTEHTHTSPEGARINAASFVEDIRSLQDCPLNKYLLKS